MEELPFVDEHRATFAASRDRTWGALLRVADKLSLDSAFARVLGTTPRSGFEVVESIANERLVLAGRHRFSRYRLVFEIEDDGIRAKTFAAFPGVGGTIYRGLVIGTRGHAIVVRRLLRNIEKLATA